MNPGRNLPATLAAMIGCLMGAVPAAPAPATASTITWSKPIVSQTPQNDVPFNGPYSREEVEVVIDRLEPHEFIEISFDLLILRAWDGSVPINERSNGRPPSLGPDFFRLGLDDGRTLLYTTFSNNPDERFRRESLSQNYPSPVAGDLWEPQAGAIAKNDLGYTYPWAPPLEEVPMDATYRLRFVVPHRERRLVLQMAGMNLQDLIDESWGVSNLSVRPLDAAKLLRPKREELDELFDQAIDPASLDALGAFGKLVLGGDESAEWIAQAVKPQPVNPGRVRDLVALLGTFDSAKAARDAAALELRALGARAEPLLRGARVAAKANLEQRQRIDWLLQAIIVAEIADMDLRRFILATRALEMIGTPRALEVRRTLSVAPPQDGAVFGDEGRP